MAVEAGYRPPFEISVSPGFGDWLGRVDATLAFAIPPSKVVFVGRDPDGELSILERTFDKTMGMARDGTDRLYLATRFSIWRLDDAGVGEAEAGEGFDRCYVPRQVWITGNVNTHDLGVDPRGGPAGGLVFVATRFSCLARPSEELSFEPIWQPPFLDGFGPGDRCHLNGLAMGPDGPAYATSVGTTDALERWRWTRAGGGAVTHVPTGEIVASGLSMPHSPRLHDGELWLTNSGTGELCHVDPDAGTWEPVAFAPGFLRGLTFVDGYAIVGSSKPREGDLYSGMSLDAALAREGTSPRLGLFVVELATGNVVEWLFLEGEMRELFDVVALPGVRRATAVGLVADEIRRHTWFDADAMARGADGRWRATASTSDAGSAAR